MRRRKRARRFAGLTLLFGSSSYIGGSWLAARALAERLISAEGLAPTPERRESLLDSLRKTNAFVEDFRHPGSARNPVELAAIFASPRQPDARPTILFLHGKGGNSAEWQPDALRALRLGYNVLLPDLRGHRPSGGDFVTYGFLEKDDLEAALAVARDRFGLDPQRVGIHSCSAGSTVALEFAAEKDGVRALWLESPYADAREMAQHYLALSTGLPRWLLGLTTHWAVRRAVQRIRRELGLAKTHAGLEQTDPLRAVGRIRARICLVHGEKDLLVPPRFVRRLKAALPAGSQVWSAAGAGHCHHEDQALNVSSKEYERRWREFFGRHLPVEPVSS